MLAFWQWKSQNLRRTEFSCAQIAWWTWTTQPIWTNTQECDARNYKWLKESEAERELSPLSLVAGWLVDVGYSSHHNVKGSLHSGTLWLFTALWYYCISMMRVILYVCICIFFPNSLFKLVFRKLHLTQRCALCLTRNSSTIWPSGCYTSSFRMNRSPLNRFYSRCNVLSNQTSSLQLFTMRTHGDPFITKWIYF